ncbi:MAG: PAS domain-containing protein [Cyanobacteria bacterium SZAS-4]|nr:PAS domain-containing protein [Cyanobacteria bacterium SZAS-4]
MTIRDTSSKSSELLLLRAKIHELETRVEQAKLEKKLASGGYKEFSDKERLRRYIDSNIVAIHRADIYGNITEANDATVKLLGYPKEDLYSGKVKWTHFTPPEFLHMDKAAIEQLRETGRTPFFRKEYIRSDGSRVPVLVQVTAVNREATDCFTIVFDLTESDKLERQLQESEKQFRALAEAIPHIVWMCDPTGKIAYANKRWFDFTGLSPNDHEGRWLSVLHPDDRKLCLQEAERAFRTNTDFNMEIRYRAANGTYVWHLVRAHIIDDPKNGEKIWFGTSTDIDDKKRASDEIKESEMRFRMLADAIPQIVFTANPNGEIDFFNDRWFEFTGLSLAQSQNNGWQLLIHPDDLPRYMNEWQKALDTGDSHEIEFRLRRAVGVKTVKNHAYRSHLARAVALRGTNGSVIKWFATWTEIEGHK